MRMIQMRINTEQSFQDYFDCLFEVFRKRLVWRAWKNALIIKHAVNPAHQSFKVL